MVTRISGLASGMDIDSMVKQMLSVDRIKVDKVSQSKQKLEWKQQLYNDLNKEMANFLINARKNLGLSKNTSTGITINTGLSSIGWHKTATSSDDTKVTATVLGTNSFSGTHSLEVKSLAEGVTATSTGAIGNIDKNAATEGLGYSGTFKINGKEVTVETKDTLSTLAKKINSSGAGVKASYDSTLDRFFLQTDAVGASAELKIESDSSGIIADLKLGVQSTDQTSVTLDASKVYSTEGKISATGTVTSGAIRGSQSYGPGYSGEIKIGGASVILAKSDSMAEIVQKINNAGANVKASYDYSTGNFSLENTSGVDVDIEGSTAYGSFLSTMGGVDGKLTIGAATTKTESILNPTGLGYSGTINIGGKDIVLKEQYNMEDIVDLINVESGTTKVTASYDYVTGKLSFNNSSGGDISISGDVPSGGDISLKNILGIDLVDALPDNIANGTTVYSATTNPAGLGHSGEIQINGKLPKITIESTDSLDDIIGKINGVDGITANVTAGVVSITTDTNGIGLNFTGTNVGGAAFINSLGLTVESASVAGTLSANGSTYTGVDGQVEYNGIATSVTSNNFTFNGVNFTAKDVTEAGKPVTVTVATDTQVAMDKIKDFVEEYNKIVEKMGSVIGEKANRNYQPLTEEQKEVMTEKEVELWEERAKKGLLSRDDTINRTLSSLRGSLYDKLKNATGTFSHISEMGITTEKYTSGSIGGKLAIDEEKLRAALNSDADSVLEMLFKDGEASDVTSSGTTKEDPRGIFTRISDNLIDGMKNIIDRSGTGDSADLFRNVKSTMLIDFITGNNMSKQGSISMLDKDMLDMSKQIDSLNTWLFNRENAYYARFTAMEKAMQQASAQSGWLMQQTGGN